MGAGFNRIFRSVLSTFGFGTRRKGLSASVGSFDWLILARMGVISGGIFLVGSMAYAGMSTWLAPEPAPASRTITANPASQTNLAVTPTAVKSMKREPLQPGIRYVRRNNSVLRIAAKPNAKALARKPKGSAVTVLSISADGWAEVKDGEVSGFMRASVLGEPQSASK